MNYWSQFSYNAAAEFGGKIFLWIFLHRPQSSNWCSPLSAAISHQCQSSDIGWWRTTSSIGWRLMVEDRLYTTPLDYWRIEYLTIVREFGSLRVWIQRVLISGRPRCLATNYRKIVVLKVAKAVHFPSIVHN